MFKASQVDRKFSYGRLTQRIEQNRFRQTMIERVRNYTDEQRLQVAAILQELEAEKQRQQQPEPPRRNLLIAGVPLTEKQIEMLREGEPVFVRGPQLEGYVVMDDRLQMAWVYRDDPRDWVEYGKYTMRRMDRDRIEVGYVVRAHDLPGELGRSPQTTPFTDPKAAGPSATLHHSEEEVARPESVTKFCRMTVCTNWN